MSLYLAAKIRLKSYLSQRDHLVKRIEFIRKLYRYPNKMLGRHVVEEKNNNAADVLVFCAHQDDDVLGLGTVLNRHRLKGDTIKIVFVTNGTAGRRESWFARKSQSEKLANTRNQEAINALKYIDITEEDIFFLGFPDGGTQRYLEEIYQDLISIFYSTKPKKVYVHCIEGGHIDHDMTSYLVKTLCNREQFMEVYEWSEYNPVQPIGTPNIKFLSNNNEKEEIIIDISDDERKLKKRMLACHKSQAVEQYFMEGEAIRKANIYNIDQELTKHCLIPNKRVTKLITKYKTSLSTSMIVRNKKRQSKGDVYDC
ncbi:PIG-L family deacetylase [Caldibacillus lycopersici]|uniref:PIG-L family deacetylase n=1 Tax=Perspicuibacillus lycopersici TaxID=1325689 RepID=A0AAE3IRV8_9BACI|nr:PIG-L family deacetylase [Perspicuibacillus lycopersici]MCU9612319.1 PIG-L family deacetylase [Perspicuibacillus lycopersici]